MSKNKTPPYKPTKIKTLINACIKPKRPATARAFAAKKS